MIVMAADGRPASPTRSARGCSTCSRPGSGRPTPSSSGPTSIGWDQGPGARAGRRDAADRPGHDGHRALDGRPPRPAPEGDRRPRPRHRPAAARGSGGARPVARRPSPGGSSSPCRWPTSSRPAGCTGGRPWRRSSRQSASRFLDVEILAKATFLTQVIEEVDVPPLAIAAGLGDLGRLPGRPQVAGLRPAGPDVSASGRSARARAKVPTAQADEDGQGDQDDLAGPARPLRA